MRRRYETLASERICNTLLLLSVFGLGACTQHPVSGLTDSASQDEPWEDQLTISGALPVPEGQVEIEVATDHDASEFVSLATVTSSDVEIGDPSLPTMYTWQYEGTIPENRWIRGASGGYRAQLRAWYRPPAESMEPTYLLGNSEYPNTGNLCGALNFNPGMFQSIAASLEPLCLSTPGQHDLIFSFKTPDYNNNCGGEKEACCATGPSCDDVDLICDDAINRCLDPEEPEEDLDEGMDYGDDDSTECAAGDIQIVEFKPDECWNVEGFVVSAYRECRNGKWSEPIAENCAGKEDGDLPPGVECYCTISDGYDTRTNPYACGAGGYHVCSFNKTLEDHTYCIPGMGCSPMWNDPGPWKCQDSVDEDTPNCWKPADLKPTTIGDCQTVGLPDLDEDGNAGPVPIVDCGEGAVNFPCREAGGECASSECCDGLSCIKAAGAAVGECKAP